MIIRTLRLRHGRVALPKASAIRRLYSSVEETAEGASRVAPPQFLETTSTAQAQLDSIPSIRSVVLNDPNHPVAQDYAFFQHQKARTAHLGTAIVPHYKPHELLTNPPWPKDITLELLLASQAHIGHATSLWNPANARYIYGVRGRKKDGESPIHIISLDVTAAHLRRACRVVSGVTRNGGLVLFVGTREGQARAVVKAAEMSQGCHLFTKWTPGSITNGQQILGACAKKVVNEFDEELEGFESQLGDQAAVKPDLVVCLNPLENYILLHECGLNNIPTIGIVDTDVNPTWVTYPIPANDDSLRCVQVIAGVLGRAGQEGQKIRRELANRGVYTSHNHALLPPARKRRQGEERAARPRRDARQAHAPAVADQLDEHQDLTGVEVRQHEEDQALLRKAEAMMHAEAASPESAFTSTAKSAEEITSLLEEDVDDSYSAAESVDQSLVDENHGSDYEADDLEQFGGVDQLQARQAPDASGISLSNSDADDAANPAVTDPTTSTWPDITGATSGETSPIDQVDDVQEGLHKKTEGESPIEQVEDVAEELGEDKEPEVPAGNPEVGGQSTEYGKDLPSENGKK